MVSQIVDIEILLCQSEVEALTLETNLIKHLVPKYNILMKDDKNLSYIKITNTVIPEVYRTRLKLSDWARYFGPYTSGSNISMSLKNLRRIFKIRDCKMRFAKNKNWEIEITDRAGRSVPCMDYYINLCPAPCVLKEKNIAEHRDNILELENFLKWNVQEVLQSLKQKMSEYAKKLEFENAAKVKASIDAIAVLIEKQVARDAISGDHDICILYEKYEQSYIGLTKIRDGKIIGVLRFEVDSQSESSEEILSAFLARQYIGEEHDLPEDIFLEKEITDTSLLQYFSSHKISLVYPKIWPKKEILDFTKNQVRDYAYKKNLETLENKTLTRVHMENILSRLWYSVPKEWPIIFECYDISHTHGQFTYASRVVIKNWKPDTSMYKKYKIKGLKKWEIDDFASHKEVMRRRTVEGFTENNFPNLIIIDWGKWQLSSALTGIEEGKAILAQRHQEEGDMFYESIRYPTISREHWLQWLEEYLPICSIAKREEEVFIPGQKEPIMFEKWTPELMVIQKARDESHRFSITSNRNARDKAMKKNMLEELPGIGPITRKKLLKLAGSVADIHLLREEELQSILNKNQIQTLRDHGLYWV